MLQMNLLIKFVLLPKMLPLNTEIIPVASSHIYLHLIEIYGCIHLLGEVDVNQNKCQIQLENIT